MYVRCVKHTNLFLIYAKTITFFPVILLSFFSNKIYGETDQENIVRKNHIAHYDPIQISGTVRVAGGYLLNNEYGQDGYYGSIFFQPQIVLLGIPVNLSWGLIQPSVGPVQLGRFNFSFSRDAFRRYLNDYRKENTSLFDNDSLREFNSKKMQLSDMNYLQKVSGANVEYHKLINDSLSGNLSAIDLIKMDSLRAIVSEYESLNDRYHELKNTNVNGYNNNFEANSNKLKSDTLVNNRNFKNYKGEAKSISDSLDRVSQNPDLSRIQNIFMRFDKISVGYDVLNHSKLSVMGYPFFGGGIDYNYKGLVLGATAGKHSAFYNTSSFSFSNGLNFPSQFTDKTSVLHVKAGVGNSENSSILSLTNFHSSGSVQGNLNAINETGDSKIFNLKTERTLSENSKIRFEISKASNPGSKSDNTSSNVLNEMAMDVISENALPKLNANVKLEYLNIGNGFHTVGNPYLSYGFQLLNFCISKSILKDKLSGDLSLNQSWSNADGENSKEWRRFSGSVSLGYKVNSYFYTYWRHFSNTLYSNGSSYNDKQNSESDQVSLNFIPGKTTSVNLTMFTGTTKNNEVVVSKNYMASSSFTMQRKKNAFTAQLNFYKTEANSESVNSFSVSLGDRVSLGRRWSVRLTTGANFLEHNTSSLINYGLGYAMGKNIMFDLSGGINTYFSQVASVPVYSRFQTMCGININF